MTTTRFLPGDAAPQTAFAAALRVNHAGEYGAKRIYAGQLAILGKGEHGDTLRHMAAQEQEHLDFFDRQLHDEKLPPTRFLPLWHIAGFALGAGTALLGAKAAMACTVAVEEVIDAHYQAQETAFADSHPELVEHIAHFRSEELEHRAIGLENGAEQAPAYPILSAIIKTGCKIAIKISERL